MNCKFCDRMMYAYTSDYVIPPLRQIKESISYVCSDCNFSKKIDRYNGKIVEYIITYKNVKLKAYHISNNIKLYINDNMISTNCIFDVSVEDIPNLNLKQLHELINRYIKTRILD